MKQDLYLNGQRMDLGKADISLKFVNNMLTSVDKFSSSYSYTISLPRTARNEGILGLPSFAGSGSALVGKYIDAEYYRDGILITRGAKAYITDTDADNIKIVLVWDTLAEYSEFLNAEPTIAELGLTNPTLSATADDGRKMSQAVYQAAIQTPAGEVVRPCLNFARLLQMICGKVGIDASFITLGIENWAIPCTKMDGGWQSSKIGRYYFHIAFSGSNPQIVFEGVLGHSNKDFLTKSGMQVGGKGLANVRVSSYGIYARVREEYLLTTPTAIQLNIVGSAGTIGVVDVPFQRKTQDGFKWVILNCPAFEFETDAESANLIKFYFTGIQPDGGMSYDEDANYSDISIYPEYKDAAVGLQYHIENNAPDLKQIDILKAFSAMMAMSLVTIDGQTQFRSISQLGNRIIGQFYDWTGKVVNWKGVPEASHKVGSYARKNTAQWEEDSKNGDYNPTATIAAQSDILKEEATFFKLPFAATKDGIVECYVEENGKKKNQDVKPRILKAEADETTNRIRLVDASDFDIAKIVQKYKVLEGALRKPVTITAHLYLTALELAHLDMSRAVYLEQTGRFYMIDNIKMDNSTDVCEAELVQLEN